MIFSFDFPETAKTATSCFQSSVDRMMQRGNASMMMGASSWKDQFLEAFTVQAGESVTLNLAFTRVITRFYPQATTTKRRKMRARRVRRRCPLAATTSSTS